jgi:hypothetical protein
MAALLFLVLGAVLWGLWQLADAVRVTHEAAIACTPAVEEIRNWKNSLTAEQVDQLSNLLSGDNISILHRLVTEARTDGANNLS